MLNRYKVLVTVPAKQPWRAILEERYIEAENLNYLLMKYATVEEVRSGVRIVKIYRKADDEYGSWIELNPDNPKSR